MRVDTLTTQDLGLLRGVRQTLADADDVLLCVAFVDQRGLRLVKRELELRQDVRSHTRLLVTTVFGSTDTSALSSAQDLGVHVRQLNPGGRTYHPKVYLGSKGSQVQAVIGSANLTAGLATNYEVGVWLRGDTADAPLVDVRAWTERLWDDPHAEEWDARRVSESAVETFAGDLSRYLQDAVAIDPCFLTLTGQRPNRVVDVSATEVLIETERSRLRGPPERIPSWMFNLAWEYLKAHGYLDYDTLTNELRVHRSSAVLAVLARHPLLEIVPGKAALRLRE